LWYHSVEEKTETVYLRCSEEGGRSMQEDILGKAIDIDELVAAAEPMPQRVCVLHLARGFEVIEQVADHHLCVAVRSQGRFDCLKVVLGQSVVRVSECHPFGGDRVEPHISGRCLSPVGLRQYGHGEVRRSGPFVQPVERTISRAVIDEDDLDEGMVERLLVKGDQKVVEIT